MTKSKNTKILPWQQNSTNPIKVAIVGDIILDEYIDGAVHRISPEAPVPVHLVNSEYVTCGGAGNVALNIQTAGAEALLFGVCGKDEAGTKLLNNLLANKISTNNIVISEERPTIRKTRVRSGQQQLLRIDWERTSSIPLPIQEALVAKVAASACDAILISDYGKGGISDAMIASLVKIANDKGIPTIVDPKGRDFSRYQGVTLITPNKKEALEAIGEDELSKLSRSEIAKTLQKKWALKNVLLTLGGEGMLLWRENEAEEGLYLPTEAREVFDVSGAGDTVVAMMAISLAAQAPYSEAIKIANTAAGIVVQKWGTQPILLADLEKALTADSHPPGSAAIIWARGQAKEMALTLRQGTKKRLVFSNGCFDILHAGHIDYLEKARALGDALIIGLNSDKSISNIKGPDRPIVTEDNRARLMAALGFVDAVIPFDEDTPAKLIEEISPDILVKGADWAVDEIAGAPHVLASGGQVKTIELVPGLSTTEIINKVLSTQKPT